MHLHRHHRRFPHSSLVDEGTLTSPMVSCAASGEVMAASYLETMLPSWHRVVLAMYPLGASRVVSPRIWELSRPFQHMISASFLKVEEPKRIILLRLVIVEHFRRIFYQQVSVLL
jgi:hypothetical protein